MTNDKRVFTGIKPSGTPHIGNYIGSIRPALKLESSDSIFFIADQHSLTTINDSDLMRKYSYEIAASWIACGLDYEKCIFYKQSDISEIFELSWILSCFTPKGLMNRAHAYKSIVESNKSNNIKDTDLGVNMGTYTYPILMSSDILLFGADVVPVGKDQVQHVEIARDISQKFNHIYGETFKSPEYHIDDSGFTIPGLDGRKMSKSYHNTIPLFCSKEDLKKYIFKIKTDSSGPQEPKDPDSTILYTLYKEFSSVEASQNFANYMRSGASWGEIKEIVFKQINDYISPKREVYNELLQNTDKIDTILNIGKIKAKEISAANLKKIKSKIGFI